MTYESDYSIPEELLEQIWKEGFDALAEFSAEPGFPWSEWCCTHYQ